MVAEGEDSEVTRASRPTRTLLLMTGSLNPFEADVFRAENRESHRSSRLQASRVRHKWAGEAAGGRRVSAAVSAAAAGIGLCRHLIQARGPARTSAASAAPAVPRALWPWRPQRGRGAVAPEAPPHALAPHSPPRGEETRPGSVLCPSKHPDLCLRGLKTEGP